MDNLSRSALEQFTRCPRCFYLQRRLKVKLPSMVPLTLAVATDALLKNEFDTVRSTGATHPLWEREQLNVRAFVHPEMEAWRNNFQGIRIEHKGTGCLITGAIDDVWQDRSTGALHIVDYKSTSKADTPTLETGWGPSYKRQIEIYQWLFKKAEFDVHAEAYFLYVNGSKSGGFFENGLMGVMRFDAVLLRHVGATEWVDDLIERAVECLRGPGIAEPGAECELCLHVTARQGAFGG